GYCENCGKYGRLDSYNARKWGHLYFIPLIPEGPRVRVVMECKKCSHGVHIPEDEVPATLSSARQSVDRAVAALLEGKKEFDDEDMKKPCARYVAGSAGFLLALLASEYVDQVLTMLEEKGVTGAYCLVQGEMLEFQGKPDDAAVSYKRAAEADPSDAAPLIALASIYVNKKDHETAKMLYERALELSDDKFVLHQVLLTIYQTLKDYQKLVDTYEHCFKLVPEMANDKKTAKAYKKACKKAGRHPAMP
ncbi:tetratricopeptide repeat protein, partial [Planctomycetota bacterium]